jgi:hypothetical protein
MDADPPMKNNPYAPPTARVTDIESEAARVAPWQVRSAVYLLWASLALSMPSILSGIVNDGAREGRLYMIVMWVVLALMIAFAAWLITSIGRGRHWARIVYAALTAWSFFSIWSGAQRQFEESWIFGVLYVITSAMDIVIIVLLFLPPSNTWFRPQPASSGSN